MNNGIVNDVYIDSRNAPFSKLFDKQVDTNVHSLSLSHMTKLSANKINSIFFSKENIDALQHGIINYVSNMSHGKYQVPKQSVSELLIVMRSIYTTEAKHLPYNILEQVKELNKKVLDYCAPEVFKSKQFKEKYLKDISSLPVPLDRSEYTSSKGEKTIEFKGF